LNLTVPGSYIINLSRLEYSHSTSTITWLLLSKCPITYQLLKQVNPTNTQQCLLVLITS
jgi:hypothetical protein